MQARVTDDDGFTNPKVFSVFFLVFSCILGACQGPSPGQAAGGRAGGGGDPGINRGGHAGAGVGGAPAVEDCGGGATFTYVVRSIATMGAATDAAGIARNEIYGFDLDSRDSDGTRPEDCGLADGVSSDGRRGIDNTIAGLWTEDFGHGFVPSETEARAGMISVIRLSGVDSFDDDGCVDVAWLTDTPQFTRARIEAGRLVAEGSGPVPVQGRAFQSSSSFIPLAFPLSSPRITFRPSAGALTEGVVGGSMTLDQLREIYRRVLPIVPETSMIGHPDLPSGGEPCVLLSAGFAFEATAAQVE